MDSAWKTFEFWKEGVVKTISFLTLGIEITLVIKAHLLRIPQPELFLGSCQEIHNTEGNIKRGFRVASAFIPPASVGFQEILHIAFGDTAYFRIINPFCLG